MGSVVFLLCLYFVVPIFLGKVVLGASAQAILIAYGIWFGGLLLWGFSATTNVGEAIGWPLIMGMFLTIPAIPVIVGALRMAGLH